MQPHYNNNKRWKQSPRYWVENTNSKKNWPISKNIQWKEKSLLA
jgi:hypothetical protein